MMILRLVTYMLNDDEAQEELCGALVEGGVVDLESLWDEAIADDQPDCWCCYNVLALLTCPKCLQTTREALGWLAEQDRAKRARLVHPLENVRLRPPVTPTNIFCLAGNYMAHVRESKQKLGAAESEQLPVTPRIFTKPVSSTLRGAGDPIVLARTSTFVDYEAEMAVIIGKRGRYIKAEDALEYVAGVTCLNDISERQLSIWERPETRAWDGFFDWLNGKWMDSFGPMGPCVVPTSDLDLAGLSLKLYLNEELMQEASTADMIFSVPRIIEYLSSILTIEPGDVIATGTPAGVGFARGVQLKHDDTVRVELENVGALSNPVVVE